MRKVVIIGSGLGGLSCGYILQKNGYDVTILEQSAQAGGCLQSFVRKGVKFETGMHFIGSALKGEIMDSMFEFLGLSNDIALSSLDRDAYNTICLGNDVFRISNGREAFLERFSSWFPAERDALVKYLHAVDNISKASSLASLSSPDRDIAANTEYQTRSMDEVLDSIFKDNLLKNIIAGDLPLYSARKGRTPFALHAFIMDFYNRSAFRIAGGSDVIAKGLSRNVIQAGGRILTGRKAIRIECDSTKATGVICGNGERFPADHVISTVHPARLAELLENTHLVRPAFRSRMSNLPQTSSVFSVYVKFKEETMPYLNSNMFVYPSSNPWDCESYDEKNWPGSLLYMHNCHEDKAKWAKGGTLLSYMKPEDVAKWSGTVVGNRGEDYEEFKRMHAERIMDLIERYSPGFRTCVDSFWTSTPLTYRDYTGTQDGSIYGVMKDVTIGPAGRVPYRTRIPNLFLAGQNVNSHGILGVLVGTIVTCSEFVNINIWTGNQS